MSTKNIPSEEQEREMINAGVPVGPIQLFKETAKERRLRLFLANEDAIQNALAPAVTLDERIRRIVREELALAKPRAKRKK